MAEVRIEAIEALRKGELEEVLDALLRAERSERFEPGTVDIDGPRDIDIQDGGRDNRVEIRKSAHTPVDDPLLPAEAPVEVVYSCKTTNNPEERERAAWKDKLREAVDPGKAWDKRGADNPAAPKRREAADALYRSLAAGGRYVVVLGWRPAGVSELRKELVARLEWRLSVDGHGQVELGDRVVIRDANYLKRAIERLDRRLQASVRKRLGLEDAAFWQDWAQWSKRYSGERRRMDFVADAKRERLLARLFAFLHEAQPDDRTIHVWGPPGVGKTRLVHELLSGVEEVEARVRYTADLAQAVAWLNARPSIASDAIVVVDEAQAPNLRSVLLTPFNVASDRHRSARLIAIGPLHKNHAGEPPPLEVERLDDREARALLAGEAGDDAGLLDRLVSLCGGFPLFVLWLGHALGRNPALLAEPGARLTGSSSEWDVCVAVLDSPDADEARASARAKTLLLALLVPDGRWQRLPDDEQDQLARALAEDWTSLMREQGEVESRGFLRRLPDHSVYVSPQNLERMLLNHFFGGSNPPLDPEAVRARSPERYPKLLARAQEVGASERCKRKLASAQLRGVEACATRSEWVAWMRALLPAARVEPERAVAAIEAALDRLGPNQIAREPEFMARLRSTLAHLSQRELGESEFARVETSLFRLVDLPEELRDPDSLGLWTQLFAVSAYMTRQAFSWRAQLLKSRLAAAAPRQRVLAIAALARALDLRIPARGIDGALEFERLAEHEAVDRLEHYWEALLGAAEDRSDEVASAARRAIVDTLRQGLRAGLSPAGVDRLADSVRTWSVEQRDALDERVDEARSDDAEIVARRGPELGRALASLSERLVPKTLAARLRAQVGRRRPGPWPLDSEARAEQERRLDAQLADELIASPEQLVDALDWLVSDRAVRARSFALALGQRDSEQRVFASLRTRLATPAGLDFATGYLLGWGQAAGRARFDAWLGDARSREPADLLVRVLARLEPNARRVELLRGILREDASPRLAFTVLAQGSSWTERAPIPVVDELIERVAGAPGLEPARVAVGAIAARLRRTTELGARTRAAMHELLDRATSSPLPAVVERHWVSAIVALVSAGDLAPLRAAFERSLRADTIDHPDHVVAALRRLAGSGVGDQLWPLVADLLEDQPSTVRLAITLHETHLLHSLTPRLVLDWVGDDLGRARIVATQLDLESEQLDAITRGLLARFGPRSWVAKDLASQVEHPPRPRADRVEFLREQARRARAWAGDADEAVSEWASELAERLERRAGDELDDEQRRLRYG